MCSLNFAILQTIFITMSLGSVWRNFWQSHLLSHPVVPLRVAFSRNLRSLFWPCVVFEGAAVLGEHIEAKRGGDFGWHLGPPCSARLIQSSHQGGLRDHLNLQAGASKLVGELRSLRLFVTYVQSLDIRKQIFTDITHHRLVCLQRAPLFNQFPRLIVGEKGDRWVFRAPSSHTHTGVGAN